MAGYQDLSEFERGVIVGAQEMEHSISEESGKTSNLRHHCGRKKIMQERDERRLTRIIKRDRRATFPQISTDFNARPSTGVTCEPFNETSSIWAFGD
ncbi:HTH_Tnp_Tc3_2 domain-containing protein [Trichonephila clavipes]|uniref:HTH_Tnp_Tc3_2 domain-containing protein n=1 Tax=Trichonephila clavipes TaxID=2585209 RepID=A0A8X6T6V7_TRICX|nr:HTH_Tnp_Tc3_2 domain-containing protein [Trichonephila clavipes]